MVEAQERQGPDYPAWFTPFKDRDGEWDDIEPIEQYEGGPAPIAAIPYPPIYEEVMGYFRAIINLSPQNEKFRIGFDLRLLGCKRSEESSIGFGFDCKNILNRFQIRFDF